MFAIFYEYHIYISCQQCYFNLSFFYCKYNGVHVFLMNMIKNGKVSFSGKSAKIIGNKLSELLRYIITVIYSCS